MNTFGPMGSLDPQWRADLLVRADCYFNALSRDYSASMGQITCHKLMPDRFLQKGTGLQQKSSALADRFRRLSTTDTGSHPSTHAWAVAVDLTPENA